MKILEDRCVGCGKCRPYCPVGAIGVSLGGRSRIDSDLCVECGTCERVDVCRFDAIEREVELPWPRMLRRIVSDPTMPRWGHHGSEKNKKKSSLNSDVEFELEFGRPGLGIRIGEIEKILSPLIRCGVVFETGRNTLGNWMIDRLKGIFQDEVKNERVMRGSVCFVVSSSKIPTILEAIEDCSVLSINTIFSLSVTSAVENSGAAPMIEMLEKMGCKVPPSCKTFFVLNPQKVVQGVEE